MSATDLETGGAPAPIVRRFPFGRQILRNAPAVPRKTFKVGILRPAIVTLAAIACAAAVLSIATTYWRSYSNFLAHTAPVHPDNSTLNLRPASGLPSDRVEFVIRDLDGQVKRVAAGRAETETFMRQALTQLAADERRIKLALRRDVDALLAAAFADRGEAVERYADWFFEWKRSYVVLKEVIVSAANRTVEVGRYERFSEAVENDVRDYFIRHYSAQVLKPEIRDPAMARGVEAIARHAQESARQALASADLQAQLFLARNGKTLEILPADTPISQLALDWNAQKWKAPTHLMEDRAFDAVVGLGAAGAGGAVGAVVLRPAMDRALARAFSSISSRFATQIGARVALAGEGAIAGTAVLPGPGTLAGALIGGLAGFAADYAINEAQAALKRDEFVSANQQALDATIAIWSDAMARELDGAVEGWMQQAKASIVLAQEQQKPIN